MKGGKNMSAILEALKQIFYCVFGGTYTPTTGDPITYTGMVQTVVTTITGNPLLLFFAILGVSMIAVGVVKRLLRVD